jgi:hypothetical protein
VPAPMRRPGRGPINVTADVRYQGVKRTSNDSASMSAFGTIMLQNYFHDQDEQY